MVNKPQTGLKSYGYYESLLSNPNVQAALNTVSWSDGMMDHPKAPDPYSSGFGYAPFDNSGWHPNTTRPSVYGPSSAMGKYQEMRYSFGPVAAELGIPNITPTNQDIVALALIDRAGALPDVLNGNVEGFASKLAGVWTSLPSGPQSIRNMAQTKAAYEKYAAAAKNNPSNLGGLMMNSAQRLGAASRKADPVTAAQNQLATLGYAPGEFNGVYGSWEGKRAGRAGKAVYNEPLLAAVAAFQSNYGLPVTGQMDQKTLEAINVQATAQDARDARLGALPAGKNQQNMARPTGPNVGGMPRNLMFPDRVIAPTQRPNVAPAVNPSAIQRMQDNLTSKMAFARPNPSNMNISGYGFSTPAQPAGPQATGSATGSINRASVVGNLSVPGRAPGVLGGRGNINPPNVVAPPANVLSNFDQFGRFTGNQQSSKAPTSDFRSTLADRANVPQSLPQVATPNAPIQSMDDATRAAQAQTAKQMARDQFARDLIKSMPAPTPAALPQRAPAGTPGNMGAAGYGPALMDAIDIPGSGVRQAIPNASAAPTVNAPMTQQQRMDKALADMRVGIPPQDIYDENAPGRSGFRGFGAGGFLGNLLTGNIGNMAGIEGGNRLPGLLGVLQNVVQGIRTPQQAQQAAQAVQTVAPALGQVMGLPAAQQAAQAGNNMVIGRDAAGRIGWMADGGLSAGAANAGWASNNPERNYGGYGGGYDPTPV